MSDADVLGILSAMSVTRRDGRVYAHHSFGRVVDGIAGRFPRVLLCVPVSEGGQDPSRDYLLTATNIELLPQPYYASSLQGLKRGAGIAAAYGRFFRKADVVFVRGMIPLVGLAYAHAWMRRRRICHWLVGNPVALLRTHRRSGRFVDAGSLVYAQLDRAMTRAGRMLTNGWLLCNGEELAAIFRSPRTITTVSSTLTPDEFFERDDTCDGAVVRILFVGFVRPEKGVEYLLEAAGLLRIPQEWQVVIAGPTDQFPAYRRHLDEIVARLGIGSRVAWRGYVAYGPELFDCFKESDMLVLPTLSEGTPRVLVEARAHSLPVIATRVGGIPSSVADGVDGLLVPPKDPGALAAAIERVATNRDLRRHLIAEGRSNARRHTLDKFVDGVSCILGKDQPE
jgi:glycosyltransferase involved in cell wall biosynthesis